MPPSALVVTGIFSVQFGAGLAARLFTQIAPAAVTGLRLWTSAAVMALIGAGPLRAALSGLVRRRASPGGKPPWNPHVLAPGGKPRWNPHVLAPGGKPRWNPQVLAQGGDPLEPPPPRGPVPPSRGLGRAWRDAAVAAGFGLTLAVMNYSIYQSFARIPLGISVTVEFLGPLGVAVASSRRLLDVLWVGLAGGGVALLARGGIPAATGHGTVVLGFAFALLAALSWAAYILLSRATGQRFPGSAGLTIAMLVAALAITPVGVAAGGAALLRPGIVATGLGIGLLSSIIPYSLEMEALRRIPPRVFGIWMSLEPAVAALVGLVLLGQSLAAREWLAIGCVMAACAGAARGAHDLGAPEA